MTATVESGFRKRPKLGEILVNHGVLTDTHLRAALSEQQRWGGKLGTRLVGMGIVHEEAVAFALAQQLDLSVSDLDRMQPAPEVLALMTPELAERYQAFPMGRAGRGIQLAMAAPDDLRAIQELIAVLGARLQVSVATPSAIQRAISRWYRSGADKEKNAVALSKEGELAPQAKAAVQGEAAVRGQSASVEGMAEDIQQLKRKLAQQSMALRVLAEMLVAGGLCSVDQINRRIRELSRPVPKA